MSVFGGKRQGRHDLRTRRRNAMLYRLGIALCAGLAVWSALQCVLALTANQPIVVAAGDIDRGEVISASQLSTVTVPVSAAMGGMIDEPSQIIGKTARVDIDVGFPVLTAMIDDAPVPAADQTTVQVTLASVPQSLTPGDVVRLVSSSDKPPHATLSSHATVITVPGANAGGAEASTGSGSGGSGSGGLLSGSDDDGGRTVTFAMTPDEALATLKAQQEHPILAVRQ